ncbi:amino acid ABC transporter permease [Inquilinus limosus]|mgnify:CR=1 FL=1|uniref:Amino acid ABC transporter permease n=1 Tax=Inquilinus limosus MP06 TaxID=1398085 RepID=A0A0A0D3A8_9PROT|nr:amino acid ABC transporter permease [Inquilinus limosus]KGM31532.1 amino acid ABC transporter permease [Inquilinus limosus MP06]
MNYQFNFGAVWASRDLLLSGLALGLGLAAVSILIGCVIGLVGAFAATSRSRAARGIASAYVTFFRNLPILVILLFVFFALPRAGIRLDKIDSFVASLSVYAGAYLVEVFRAGIQSVPKGVIEAGTALGLRPMQIRRLLVAPLMLRNILPALGSNFISLFKDTSLAAAIAVPELTFYARKVNTESFRVIETWMVTSLLYVATCTVIALLLRRLEARLRLPGAR